eukprot:Rhum_TRINITY_DN4326_c0_g1::Rhum_TRINITY_DN4326_c0_g1_i1::g.13767::m.13767
MSARASTYVWWDLHQTAILYNDPLFATSAMKREGKPWYVCPRNPFRDGFKCDMSAFFDRHRSYSDCPSRWIPSSFFGGAVSGLSNTLGKYYMAGRENVKNKDFRMGHQWAMKRLGLVNMLRPAFLWLGVVSTYAVTRELFSQNTGRRSRRGYYDLLPHAVGMVPTWFALVGAVGLEFATPVAAFLGIGFGAFIYTEALGETLLNAHREMRYPLRMAYLYGLPDGGEGYDFPVGGEYANQYRMESEVEKQRLNVGHNVRMSPKFDDHPQFRQDWGHFTFIF